MSHRGLSSALLASIMAMAGSVALAGDYTMLKGSQMDLPPPPDLEQAARPINFGGFYIGGFGGLSQSRFQTDRSVGDLANLTLTGSTAIADYNPPALVASRPRTDSGSGFRRNGRLQFHVRSADVRPRSGLDKARPENHRDDLSGPAPQMAPA